MRIRDLKIKYKIAFTLIILVICFAIVNTIVFSTKRYKSEVENYKITGESIIKNIEPLIAEHIYVNDIVGLNRTINNIKDSNDDIIYSFILDTNNEIIVHTFSNGIPSGLFNINTEPVENIELLDFGEYSVYDFSYPVVDGRYGIIRMGLSRERLQNKIRSNILDSSIILLAFIIISIIISLDISRYITNPLDKLVRSAHKISKGDFNHQIDISSNNELGILSESFNTMCNNLLALTGKLEEQIELLNKKNNEYLALNEDYFEQNEALMKAKNKAEESDKLKTAFLANLSHEIRTPMNGILGFAELLKDKTLPVNDKQKYISIIEQSGKRMLRLLNDLLDISRIESGQIELHYEKTNLNRLLTRIYDFFKAQSQQKGIILQYETPVSDNESLIITDRNKLEEILINLIGNSLKFTTKGQIVFGYKQISNMIHFYVKDTGKGVPSDMKEIIFERFRQADTKYPGNIDGCGLGLSISKAYITIMGGSIWLESELNEGSIFHFTIPYNTVTGNTRHAKTKIQRENA